MANIHIGIPTHGGSVNFNLMGSIDEARSSRLHRVQYQPLGLSLLARNFNTLFITAFENGADFFVLHHADLAVHSMYPGTPWIDLLVERMYQLNAAVISVASPIKSQAGNLSGGIDLQPGNTASLRRLTVRELLMLPKEFICRADVCKLLDFDPRAVGPMLVNTGCWIMDLRRYPWFGLRWPGFRIKDKIHWSLDGKPAAYTEPEDWEASRWLAKHNLPYYMTRELRLMHYGGHDFTNCDRWGLLNDKSPPQPSPDRYRTSGFWETHNGR